MTQLGKIEVEAEGLHLARSRFLNAFAELETVICEVMQAGGEELKKTPLAERLPKFRSLTPNRFISKHNAGKLPALTDRIAAISTIRADLVHGLATAHVIDGQVTLKFINPLNAHEKPPVCRLMTLADLQRWSEKATELSNDIKALRTNVNPASLPQPPSPGAAGDP